MTMTTMTTTENRIAEASAAYGSAVADLQRPLILERQGQVFAVLISFEEYRRLREIESAEETRRRANWSKLSEVLVEVHSRPSSYTSSEIEAEITAARAELRQEYRGHQRSR